MIRKIFDNVKMTVQIKCLDLSSINRFFANVFIIGISSYKYLKNKRTKYF